MEKIEQKYLNIKEAAQYISIHSCTLRRWELAGIITPLRIGKRRDRRYTKEMLDNIIKQ